MKKCERLDNCSFFKKHHEHLNETCMVLVANYCFGKKKNLCKRLIYFTETNEMPSPDMAPNGMILGDDNEEQK